VNNALFKILSASWPRWTRVSLQVPRDRHTGRAGELRIACGAATADPQVFNRPELAALSDTRKGTALLSWVYWRRVFLAIFYPSYRRAPDRPVTCCCATRHESNPGR
jgi:hypothetical protein